MTTDLAQKLANARKELCEAEDLVATLQRRVAEYERQLILETSQQQQQQQKSKRAAAAANVRPLGGTTSHHNKDDNDSSSGEDIDGRRPSASSAPLHKQQSQSSQRNHQDEGELVAALTEERKLFSRLTAALEVACLIGDSKSPSKKDGVPVAGARSVMQELDEDEDFGEYEDDLDEERNQVRNLK